MWANPLGQPAKFLVKETPICLQQLLVKETYAKKIAAQFVKMINKSKQLTLI
jgi:hypothetical protein